MARLRAKRARPPGKKQLNLRKSLRREHFTKREALEFGKLWRKYVPPNNPRGKPQFVPTLLELVERRRELWAGFNRLAKGMGWGSSRKAGEWNAEIIRLYRGMSRKHTGNFFVTKDVHGSNVPRRLNPWALYDAIQDSLPVEDQWGTPRMGRSTPTGMTVKFASERRYKEKALRNDIRLLEGDIRRTGDPRGNMGAQLRSLRYNLKTGNF